MSFSKTTLKNGLRLVTVPQKGSLTTTVLFLVEAGSKYESKQVNGLLHFLQHMCFKGTERRPRPIDVASELDALGAHYNAFTSHEYTGFYAKARNEDAGKIFDVLSDIYLRSLLREEEIDKERGVIIEEINMYEDAPMQQIHELFTTLLYGDQPAGWDVIGKKEIVLSLQRNDFLSYRKRHYLPNATVLIVAGGTDETAVRRMTTEAFDRIAADEKGSMPRTIETQKGPATLTRHKETDQAHLVLGVRAFDAFDERRNTLTLIANLLGGGMSSRLFQRVREQMGAAYYIHTSNDLYSDHGYLSVSAGVALDKITNVVRAILEEFARLRDGSVDAEELINAKRKIAGSMAISLETSDELASFYGSQEVVRREILTIDQILEKINGVTAEDIRNVSREIFTNAGLNLAVIGPYKDSVQFEKILAF